MGFLILNVLERRLARDIAAAQNASAALQLLRSADVDQIHVTACLHRMASVSAHSGKPRPDEVQDGASTSWLDGYAN
eukprot:s649_g40.t1